MEDVNVDVNVISLGVTTLPDDVNVFLTLQRFGRRNSLFFQQFSNLLGFTKFRNLFLGVFTTFPNLLGFKTFL